jgi:hypothetical protein
LFLKPKVFLGFIFLVLEVKMNKLTTVLLFMCVATSCTEQIDAKKNLTNNQYDLYVREVAPFCIKKPDQISYHERTNPRYHAFYETVVKETGASIDFFVENDTAKFFFFRYKDLSSLYEHYRGLGGYFRTNEEDSITFINLLYHTPRLTQEEMSKKGEILFREMMSKGNVAKYIGNRKYVHTPNADFYYNTKLNRWDYTENSSWKFLEEEKTEGPKRFD